MGGDDELAPRLHQPVHLGEHGELPLRREPGLRLVEEVQPVPAQAVAKQGEKALPVGSFVQGAAVGRAEGAGKGGNLVQLVDVGGDVIKAFRPQKIPVPRRQRAAQGAEIAI